MARVECELIEAQNSLIRQSEGDERGLVNDDGWGLGLVLDGEVTCRREVGPAASSESYRREAARARATTVVAHVRRATVGGTVLANTHPFRHGRNLLAHNGHIDGFERVRPRLLEAMSPEHREAIGGTTDSEHVFHLLLSRRDAAPGSDPLELLRRTLHEVAEMAEAENPGEEVALNLLWAEGDRLVGSRLGRTLYYLERTGPHLCGICGKPNPDPGTLPEGAEYRAVVVASERITDEDWKEVPEASVFEAEPAEGVRLEPLGL